MTYNAQKRTKSVLFQWTLGYGSFVMILLLIGIVLNTLSIRAIKEETVNSRQYFLMAVGNDVRSMLDQADQVYNAIYFNRYFAPLSNAKSLTGEARYGIYSLHSDMTSNGVLSVSGMKYLVYFPELDIVMGDNAALDSATYYDNYLKDREMSYETYRYLLDTRHTDRYRIISDDQNQMVCYTRSNATLEGRLKVNIILFLSGGDMQHALSKYFDYNINAIALQDEGKNTVLFNNLPDSELIMDFLNSEHTGYLFELYDGDSLVVAYSQPMTMGWTCYLFSSGSEFWEQSVMLNRISVTIITIGALLSVVGIAIIMVRSYAPVKVLLGQIHRIVPSTREVRNEYQALDQALRYMHSDSQEKTLVIEETREQLRDELLLRLLHGQADTQEESGGYYDYLADNSFVLAAVRFENMNDKDRELIHQSYIEAACQAAQGLSILAVRDGRRSVLLLGLPESRLPQDEIDLFITALSQAAETMRSHDVLAFFTVNPKPSSQKELNAAYKQVYNSLEYKKIMRTPEIISTKLISSFSARVYYFPLNIEYELSQHIRQGDFENANKHLNALFHINFYQEPLHLYMTRCLLYDIIGTIAKAIDPNNNPEEIKLLEQINIDIDSNDEESLQQVQAEVEETVRVICDRLGRAGHVNAAIAPAKLELLEQMKEFIRQNIGDVSMGIDSIAAEFEISVSQLVRLFKDAQGGSLVDHINNLRIAHSKQLLSETYMTIDEIALACGYSGSKTLTRLFKKHEGVTPGVWRKIHSE